MAVDHIGLAVLRIEPDINPVFQVGVVVLDPLQAVVLLPALGIHVVLVLKPDGVGVNLIKGQHRGIGCCAVRDHRFP